MRCGRAVPTEGGKEETERRGLDWRHGAAVRAVVRRGTAANGCGVELAVVQVQADAV